MLPNKSMSQNGKKLIINNIKEKQLVVGEEGWSYTAKQDQWQGDHQSTRQWQCGEENLDGH